VNVFRWLLWVFKPMWVRVVEIDGRTRIISNREE